MPKRFRFAKTGIVLAFLLALGFAGWAGLKSGGAAEKNFLADRHQARGANCSGCHKESPPKEAVPQDMCLKCHESYAKIAKQTDKITPNPHASHMGALECKLCHHAHKPSVNHCASCHDFDFKVP